ncbi:MAG TPA: hypothetical protein VM243_12185 [Phycisphaerae bacterium]|nr:hypothetical protein [Phycisphaerae bacterium]
MPKPKDGPALFEIMRSPGFQDKAKDSRPPDKESGSPVPGGQPAGSRKGLGATGRGSAAQPTADPATGEDRPRPWFEITGGQVRLSFTSQAMAVAIFGLALLLVAAYAAGLRVGTARGERRGYQAARLDTQAAVMDDIKAARAQPPAENLFEGLGDSPIVRRGGESFDPGVTDDEPGTDNDAVWVRGYNYVVVQDFRPDAAADVEKARRYLADSGIETAVVELKGDWRYRLIATQGFNLGDPVQERLANDYLARIREFGKAYLEAGGRYRLEGYFKKLTADDW